MVPKERIKYFLRKKVRLQVSNKPLFLSGVMFIAIGAAAALIGGDYPRGTVSNMGPGYYPMILVGALGLIGLISLVAAIGSDEAVALPPMPFLPAVSIAVGVFGFGLLVTHFGLVVASIFLMLCINYKQIRVRPYEVLAVTGLLIAFSALLFVEFLEIPIRIL